MDEAGAMVLSKNSIQNIYMSVIDFVTLLLKILRIIFDNFLLLILIRCVLCKKYDNVIEKLFLLHLLTCRA